jgi:hypothetical protein
MKKSEILKSITSLTDYIFLDFKKNTKHPAVYPLLTKETYDILKNKYSLNKLSIEDALQDLTLAVKYLCFDNEVLSKKEKDIKKQGFYKH